MTKAQALLRLLEEEAKKVIPKIKCESCGDKFKAYNPKHTKCSTCREIEQGEHHYRNYNK